MHIGLCISSYARLGLGLWGLGYKFDCTRIRTVRLMNGRRSTHVTRHRVTYGARQMDVRSRQPVNGRRYIGPATVTIQLGCSIRQFHSCARLQSSGDWAYENYSAWKRRDENYYPRQELLRSYKFVCLLVRSFVRSWSFLGNYKSDFHEIWHRRSASGPNFTVTYWEVKVKVQGQNRRTE